MLQSFSSPILLEKIKQLSKEPERYGKIIKHFDQAIYALSYYLEKTIPKGAIICALYPKKILQTILPDIAKRKNCKVRIVGGSPETTKALMDVLTNEEEADIYLSEPDGFSEHGILIKPEETDQLQKHETIAIASIYQWTKTRPINNDCVKAKKIITETGIHTPENLTFSEPSIPFQA